MTRRLPTTLGAAAAALVLASLFLAGCGGSPAPANMGTPDEAARQNSMTQQGAAANAPAPSGAPVPNTPAGGH